MKPISSLSSFFQSTLSTPACNRVLYRTIRRLKVSSILEVGIGDASRATKMIRMAQKYSTTNVRYTGIDTFESSPSHQITLKDCHQKLSVLEAKLQLVPGDLVGSMMRIANSHVRTDMLVISSSYHTDELEQTWYYVPRMLHAASVVFLQDANDNDGYFEQLGRLEIERLVKKLPKVTKARAA